MGIRGMKPSGTKSRAKDLKHIKSPLKIVSHNVCYGKCAVERKEKMFIQMNVEAFCKLRLR